MSASWPAPSQATSNGLLHPKGLRRLDRNSTDACNAPDSNVIADPSASTDLHNHVLPPDATPGSQSNTGRALAAAPAMAPLEHRDVALEPKQSEHSVEGNNQDDMAKAKGTEDAQIRKAEVLRRAAEVLSLSSICAGVVLQPSVREVALELHTELVLALCILVSVILLSAVRSLWSNGSRWPNHSLPVTFDPAPLLYPTLLPTMVALSLAPEWPGAVLPSIVLGLSSIPIGLFPDLAGQPPYNSLHWLATLVPLWCMVDHPNLTSGGIVYSPLAAQCPELLSWLFPLHQCLIPALHHLTTTSLLSTELELLAVSLACLLLLSAAPQMVILGSILWIGGLGLFILCGVPLSWSLAMERSAATRQDGLRPHESGFPPDLTVRRWAYATYTYAIIIGLILWPIRANIQLYALNGSEPFCWAIGYLFSDLVMVREAFNGMSLHACMPFQPTAEGAPWRETTWVDTSRRTFGYGNVRLAIFIYWAGVIACGLSVILFLLPKAVDVDTRRKVFHGMMVIMLLPTTFVEPCFLSLGLVLVLAVFLLLDLLRASKLQPLSGPLTWFLEPYTDGRDLRGPVIVSHIFLLVGCAIPLWLSQAAYYRRTSPLSTDPWRGWELSPSPSRGHTRDLSMLSGVVCVGMGDSAASLVGRRYGRRKWPWAGGKSLEGSAAFAVSVTAGLTLGKVWLVHGGWDDVAASHNDAWISHTIATAVVAGCGASFTEAVLRGANDNVVVPIILWLLVRSLAM